MLFPTDMAVFSDEDVEYMNAQYINLPHICLVTSHSHIHHIIPYQTR